MTDILQDKLLICRNTLQDLTMQIKKIEEDTQTPAIEKFPQIKIIREEIVKVGMEIDKLKNEIKLMSVYRVN